jgi:hypothetical protein
MPKAAQLMHYHEEIYSLDLNMEHKVSDTFAIVWSGNHKL